MENKAKKIGCLFLACFLVFSKSFYVKAEALPDILSGSTTVADCIMSYYSMIGCAVADNEWITNLYGSLGSSFGTIYDFAENGLLTINNDGTWSATSELTQAIESTNAYTSLGLNEMFNISAEEAAAGGGVAAASGGAVLSGAVAGVGSTGVLPVLGGVTAAYWGGIALGTLAAHALGLYQKNIETGLPISTLRSALNAIPSGAPSVFAQYTNNNTVNQRIVVAENTASYSYLGDTGNYHYGLYNYGNSTSTYTRININKTNGTYTTSTGSISVKGTFSNSTAGVTNKIVASNNFPNFDAYNAAKISWDNGTATPIKNEHSPDIIGQNGNQKATKNDNQYTIPDVKPMIDPQTQAGKPLTMQDWLSFANSVKNNNSSADPFGNNASLYDNIMDLIVTGNPNNTDPDPNPDPWSPPVVNPVPDPSYPDPVPDQPSSENPEESENPQETEPLNPVDTGRPWMLPDLKNKFPFCIPWDIKDCFSLLNSNTRQAPHISWRFNPPHTPIDYTFNLDLRDFESAATLLRTLELIAFIVGLAFVTRYIIGAS